MGNEPATVSYDPEDHFHEAIASFEGALDAGLNPDHSCKEGVCGACETKVIEAGEIDHRDGILTKAEQAANKTIMICVSGCKRGPLVLDI